MATRRTNKGAANRAQAKATRKTVLAGLAAGTAIGALGSTDAEAVPIYANPDYITITALNPVGVSFASLVLGPVGAGLGPDFTLIVIDFLSPIAWRSKTLRNRTATRQGGW